MARSKKTSPKANKPKRTTKKEVLVKEPAQNLKLSESYISLLLGAGVVLAMAALFFIFLRSSSDKELKVPTEYPFVSPSSTPSAQEVKGQESYVVQDGESLWDVAVKVYGDGYRWVEIAEANNLGEGADYVEPGTRLSIPNSK
jgi:nucleoid-associated protein YgaU